MNNISIIAYDKKSAIRSSLDAVIGVTFFVMAMVLGAYIRIPVPGTPVPITLQTFFVLLSGAMLGKRLGFLSQFAYIGLGVLGLPVFQGYAFGFAHLLGPTGGYLAGFMLASYLIGAMLSTKRENSIWVLTSFVVANIALYALGVAWLVFLYKIDLPSALSMGVLPFVPGEIMKTSLAVLIYSRVSKRRYYA